MSRKTLKKRPARKQVEPGEVDKTGPEHNGQTYNLWYHKWAGGDKYDSASRQYKSKTRVHIAKDAGYTQADRVGNQYICLFFARGCCPKGHECKFLHRLPNPQPHITDASVDCFGREKFAKYRDDRSGVGSFMQINRTLFVSKIVESRDTADILEKHFQEFGNLERIRVLSGRGIAFVTYEAEHSAQFAREAMMHQSLDSDETLIIKWATSDNPEIQEADQAYLKSLGQSIIANRLDPEFVMKVKSEDEKNVSEKPHDSGQLLLVTGQQPYNISDPEDISQTSKEIIQKKTIKPTEPIISEQTLLKLQSNATKRPLEESQAVQEPESKKSLVSYGTDSDDD